jgi:hypothetical protein
VSASVVASSQTSDSLDLSRLAHLDTIDRLQVCGFVTLGFERAFRARRRLWEALYAAA